MQEPKTEETQPPPEPQATGKTENTTKDAAVTTKKPENKTSGAKQGSAAPAKVTTAQKQVSFPKRLQALSYRLEVMLTVGSRISSVLHRVYNGEEMYCKRVLQQLAQDRKDVKAIRDFATTEPVASAWAMTDKLVDMELGGRINVASDVVSKVVTPLNNWLNEAKRKLRAIVMQQQAWKRDLHKNEDAVIGNREQCLELLESCARAQQDEAKKKEETAQGGVSFFSKLSMGVTELYRGSLPELHRKVQMAIVDYQAKIETANKRMERYLKGDLLRVCHEYRQLAVTTVANIKTFLGIFHQIHDKQTVKAKPSVEALEKFLNTMQASGGIPAMLKRAVEDHKKVLPDMLKQQRYLYELPVTLDEIKRSIYSKFGPGGKPRPPSIFGSSLEQIMKIQKENKALPPLHRKMAVPSAMDALISLIEKLNGLKTEGIFRLSAAKEDLNQLSQALEKGFITGKFKFASTSPHVPAVMLKRWLRSLQEPLVPFSLYQEALAIVRPDGGYSSGEPTPQQTEQVREFVKKLPTIHRNVLYTLIKFAHKVNAHADVNRMNLSNLAVVLGPCVLRNDQINTQELVREARASGTFTKLLLLTLKPAPKPPSATDSKPEEDKTGETEGKGATSTGEESTAEGGEETEDADPEPTTGNKVPVYGDAVAEEGDDFESKK
uniref:Rho-GAP domain-containing protein n=1 Tax=Lotharella oceanica TaxID=641309 RepID=A0A7S2X8F2_9EUKA|mmetsp:Transcript_15856/g.30090  ORF Transcript_15856/g.30090 Transcript_15856/m.30090 type:complete len:664 (+) Transcript_15856:31-2022(+)